MPNEHIYMTLEKGKSVFKSDQNPTFKIHENIVYVLLQSSIFLHLQPHSQQSCSHTHIFLFLLSDG